MYSASSLKYITKRIFEKDYWMLHCYRKLNWWIHYGPFSDLSDQNWQTPDYSIDNLLCLILQVKLQFEM